MALRRGPQQIVTSGLALYLDAANPLSYRGTGSSWYDLSGLGNHATIYGNPTLSSSNGILNNYFTLNGSTQYVATTNALNLSATAAVTIIMNMKVESYATASTLYELSSDYATNRTFQATFCEGGPTAIYAKIYGDVGLNISAFDKSALNSLSWCSFGIIHNTAVALKENVVYKNSLELAELSQDASTNNANLFGNYTFYIGSTAGSFNFANMSLSSIMVYNRALTTAEMTQNFNSTRFRIAV